MPPGANVAPVSTGARIDRQEGVDVTDDPRVIIVGGGPVGLGAALELARFGVRSVLVEKHDSSTPARWRSPWAGAYFRADIERHLGDRRGVLMFVSNDQARGALQPLAGRDGGAWCTAAADAAGDVGVPVDAYRIGSAGLDDGGRFAEAYGLADDGAVLVRPDGHVAWRCPSGPASAVRWPRC
jgi:glycine/D-amino acid oxidase-like deaminating enzyme